MPIPLEKNRQNKINRQIAKLQRQQAGATKHIRRLLYMARIKAVEDSWGVEGAGDEMLALIDAAIELGLSRTAITAGNGMVAKLSALIDRPESQSHAVGALLVAADLLADIDADKSAQVRTIADSIDSANDSASWQTVMTPRIKVANQ